MGIADYAPFRATKGNTNDRALPGHPHRQSAHFVKRDLWTKTNAALGRAAIDIMLDTITGEHLDVAVIHAQRKVHNEFAFGLAQYRAHGLGQPQAFSRLVKLSNRYIVRIDQINNHEYTFLLVCGLVGHKCCITFRSSIAPQAAPLPSTYEGPPS